ncbi:MAG TPA: ankyrin repeat domain-containing protein [Chthonomonadaceae bacterium]|nr:ankyrin repeat domain-containing protein [Chthonomonadaceae bacterium]
MKTVSVFRWSLMLLGLALLSAPTPAQNPTKPAKRPMTPEQKQTVQALFDAVDDADPQALRKLLSEGADVNVRSEHGETLLSRAVSTGRLILVELLVSHGANVNAANTQGGRSTPLFAALGGDGCILTFLLDKGAKINFRNKDNVTALLMAVRDGFSDDVEILLHYGADRNIQDGNGNTALTWAYYMRMVSPNKQQDYDAIIKLLSKDPSTSKATRVESEATRVGMDPTVIALFAKATAAYHKLRSYAHTEVDTFIESGSGISNSPQESKPETFTLAMERPNKFSIRSNQDLPGMEFLADVFCDGKLLYTYRPQTHQYRKTSAPSSQRMDFEEFLSSMTELTQLVAWMLWRDSDPMWAFTFAHAKIGPTVTEGGKLYDTVVEEMKDLDVTSHFHMAQSYYFDANTHLLYKSVLTVSDQVNGRDVSFTDAKTLINVKVNQSLAASLFTFRPPTDAREVTSFINPSK